MAGSVFELTAPISGAKSDLVFLHTSTPYVVTTGEQLLFPEGGKMVAGAYKLLQQVVIALFTSEGGVKFYPNRGTSLATSILRSGAHNETALRELFAISREQVLSEFQSRQDPVSDYHPEEVLVDLVLQSLQILGDSVDMQIHLHTAANQILSITLPVIYHG